MSKDPFFLANKPPRAPTYVALFTADPGVQAPRPDDAFKLVPASVFPTPAGSAKIGPVIGAAIYGPPTYNWIERVLRSLFGYRKPDRLIHTYWNNDEETIFPDRSSDG